MTTIRNWDAFVRGTYNVGTSPTRTTTTQRPTTPQPTRTAPISGCQGCRDARVHKMRDSNATPRYACDTCDPRPHMPPPREYVRGITGLVRYTRTTRPR